MGEELTAEQVRDLDEATCDISNALVSALRLADSLLVNGRPQDALLAARYLELARASLAAYPRASAPGPVAPLVEAPPKPKRGRKPKVNPGAINASAFAAEQGKDVSAAVHASPGDYR